MSLVLDDLPRAPDRLLQQLQQMAEVITQQNATLISLQAERDTAWSERDAAQVEIEKLRLLIRQLQRGQFGRRSERLDLEGTYPGVLGSNDFSHMPQLL